MPRKDSGRIKKVWSPHDRYFQFMMEDKNVSFLFMNAHIDSKLRQAIDWSTFAIADTARRPTGRKPLYTDTTYHALTKGHRGHIYLHVEHERGIDETILERHLQYNVGLFLKHKKQNYQKLPLVVNFVLYNGIQEDYPYQEDICEYFEQPELARSVMGHVGKPYTLINLNKESDEVLVSRGPLGLMELLLKRASRVNFLAWMREHKELVRRLPADRYLSEGLIYVLEVGHGEADEIIDTFILIYPELEEKIMQAALQLERRGEARGIKQGIQQGIQTRNLEIAKQMLRKGYAFSTVEELTGLSSERLTSLQ